MSHVSFVFCFGGGRARCSRTRDARREARNETKTKTPKTPRDQRTVRRSGCHRPSGVWRVRAHLRRSRVTYLYARGVEGELERVAPRREFPAVARGRRRLRRAADGALREVPVLAVHHHVLAQNAPTARVLESRRAGELAQENHLGGVPDRVRGAGAARRAVSNHRGGGAARRGVTGRASSRRASRREI